MIIICRTLQEFKDCKILIIPAKYEASSFGFGFQKHSPYIQIFNFYLNKLLEKGALNRIKKKYSLEKQNCPDKSGKPLTINACFSPFVIVIGGLFVAFIILCYEKIQASTV